VRCVLRPEVWVACTHVMHCPLFPYLNDSLRGWRDSYCQTESAWVSCARYQLSARGEPVPLALLPNGHTPIALERSLGKAVAAPVTAASVAVPVWPGSQLPYHLDSPGHSHATDALDRRSGSPEGGSPAASGGGAVAAQGWPLRPSDRDRELQVQSGWWRRRWMRVINWLRGPA
jgi:hypothetical protein